MQFNAARDKLLALARADSSLTAIRLTELPDVATLRVDANQQKLSTLGLTQANVNSTLSTAWGGQYVNDFIDRGRVKRVYVQGDAQFRAEPSDLAQWFVRGANGQMAPFSSFATTSWGQAPTTLSRFNGISSYEIQGSGAAGVSSGDAMDKIAQLAGQIPGTSVSWSGLSYQERLSSGQAPILYGLSILVVFLCLAALYESWVTPLSVILAIPLGVLGAFLATTVSGLPNDLYFKVGVVTVIGLSAKNAILIVEVAQALIHQGQPVSQALISAARMRLRPIVMTSLAFMMGVLPLVFASGAGSASQRAIGTAVFGGMLSATVLTLLFVPLLHAGVVRLRQPRRALAPAGDSNT